MELPEVLRQPPAKQIKNHTENKDLPCGWSVVIDCGNWDSPLYESITKNAAEIYYLHALTMSNGVKIDLKPTEEVRLLHTFFVKEDILIKMSLA